MAHGGGLQLFPGKGIKPCSSIFANENLRLELDALLAAILADHAFDADCHVFLETPLVGAIEIGTQWHTRIFVRQSDAVDCAGVTPRHIFFGNYPLLLVELNERHSGL